MRRQALTVMIGLVAALVVAPAIPASAQPAAPDWDAEFQGVVDAFRAAYPGVDEIEAARRIDGQLDRARLVEGFAEHNPDEFGGSWYDGAADVLHLQATTPAAVADFTAAAAGADVPVEVHAADYSYVELHAEMQLLLEGTHPVLGDAAAGHAGIDIEANRVVAGLTTTDLSRSGTAAPESVRLVEREPRAMELDACGSRRNCGHPLRSGIILWEGEYDNAACSLGFTASASDGSRWAVTAGHCGANGSVWGHGEVTIGPLKDRRVANNLDVARIHVQSAYWLQSTRGWFYNFGTPNSPLPVDYAITIEGAMIPGEVVCLSAWHAVPGQSCGTLGVVNDANAGGRARVNNFDACGGDSGGGWYWRNSVGERWAYGIHSASSQGCHIAGGFSWFSTLPDINAFWDANAAATIRVDYR